MIKTALKPGKYGWKYIITNGFPHALYENTLTKAKYMAVNQLLTHKNKVMIYTKTPFKHIMTISYDKNGEINYHKEEI